MSQKWGRNAYRTERTRTHAKLNNNTRRNNCKNWKCVGLKNVESCIGNGLMPDLMQL